MKNDNSHKKYRGFKYIVLAVLFFSAVGILLYSKRDQFQRAIPQSNIKETSEEMISEPSVSMTGGLSDRNAPALASMISSN